MPSIYRYDMGYARWNGKWYGVVQGREGRLWTSAPHPQDGGGLERGRLDGGRERMEEERGCRKEYGTRERCDVHTTPTANPHHGARRCGREFWRQDRRRQNRRQRGCSSQGPKSSAARGCAACGRGVCARATPREQLRAGGRAGGRRRVGVVRSVCLCGAAGVRRCAPAHSCCGREHRSWHVRCACQVCMRRARQSGAYAVGGWCGT
jgi:hypothetical protein